MYEVGELEVEAARSEFRKSRDDVQVRAERCVERESAPSLSVWKRMCEGVETFAEIIHAPGT